MAIFCNHLQRLAIQRQSWRARRQKTRLLSRFFEGAPVSPPIAEAVEGARNRHIVNDFRRMATRAAPPAASRQNAPARTLPRCGKAGRAIRERRRTRQPVNPLAPNDVWRSFHDAGKQRPASAAGLLFMYLLEG
jgi:hypothetical protein